MRLLGIVSLLTSLILYIFRSNHLCHPLKNFSSNLQLERNRSVETLLLISFVFLVNICKQKLPFLKEAWFGVNLADECFLLLYCLSIHLLSPLSKTGLLRISDSTVKAFCKNSSESCFSRKMFEVIVTWDFLKNIVIKFLYAVTFFYVWFSFQNYKKFFKRIFCCLSVVYFLKEVSTKFGENGDYY